MKLDGIGASRGTVTGTARVILDPADCGTIKDGEILITQMTTPEYVPAFGKAAAVVTELGNVTCHAAIVAREYKIPAVVGCKQALQIATGDTVTVSVEVETNGEIRKVVAFVEIA
jgi:phosphoenolpyruvate synthase/pyruvate phosphate dikinase